MRSCTLTLAAVLMCLPGFAATQEQDHRWATITMGIRADVPPFVWRNDETEEFSGFFWDICTAALARAGYMFEPALIDARQRTALLGKGAYCVDDLKDGQRCKPERERTVDLLCDPTTITLNRMRTFAEGDSNSAGVNKEPSATVNASDFVFSPILFLANGSYIQQVIERSIFRKNLEKELAAHCDESDQIHAVFCPGKVERKRFDWIVPPSLRDTKKPAKIDWKQACVDIIKALEADGSTIATSEDDTTPQKWPPVIWPEPVPEKPQFEIWGYVRGATIEAAILEAAKRAPSSVGICPQPFDSHTEATEAFCSKRIYRYFGDVDLVRARVANYRADKDVACEADETPSVKGTYEPYALVLSHRHDHFPERFNMALYSMFSDGTIAQFFDGRFGYQRRSQYLETLFRINSLPSGIDP